MKGNNYTMKKLFKKIGALLTVAAVMMTTMPVAMAGINLDVEDAYYECASMYPDFVEELKAQPQRVSDRQIISFLESMQSYLLSQGDVITEDNFEDYMMDAVLYATNLKKNTDVRDALVGAFPGAVVDGMDGIISPEFEPLVETIKLMLFGNGQEEEETTTEEEETTTEEEETTTDEPTAPPTEGEKEEPTEGETEAPTEAETAPPTENEKDEPTEKPTRPDTGGPGGFEDDYEDVTVEMGTEAPTRPSDKTFSDINQAPWAEKAIYALVDMGVINGYPDKTFKPNNPVTRAEFAKMIVLASGRYAEKDKATYTSLFWDVPKASWEYPFVSAALKFGFIKGRSETIFDPASNITRADLCLIVYRYIKSMNSEFKAKDNATIVFADSSAIPVWDVEAVNVLASHGIATVRDTVNNKFEPTLPATRAECAVMIHSALNAAFGLK